MAKIGYMVLNKGQWDNKQIVSEEWINESLSKKTNAVNRINYGYQWWNFEVACDILEDIGHASGHGGQYIFIIEDLNMVVVTTANNGDIETKHTIYDLLFDIMVSNPFYKEKVVSTYNLLTEGNLQDFTYSDNEYMNLAHELIAISRNSEAIKLLKGIEKEDNSNNWFYQFLLGKAYYNLNNYENATLHFEQHLLLNKRTNKHEQAYYDMVMEMIEAMNK